VSAKRDRIPAAHWWKALGDTFDKICREYITRAKKAERATYPDHECGHRWEISVRSTLHISGVGEHVDADWADDNRPVTVRAHNLRDALLIAATLPLSDWFDEERPEARAEALGATESAGEGENGGEGL
jgi:hypothetical protein